MNIKYVHPITIRSVFFLRNPFFLTDFLGFQDRMAYQECREFLAPQGPQGQQGKDGAKGEPGVKGPRGMTGTRGQKGNPGSLGKNGAPGMMGIKGDKGHEGSRGSSGPPGIKGVKGEQGSKGEKGETVNNAVSQTNWKQRVWKNTDSRDSGKIKVEEYLEKAMKNKLSVRAILSWPSLKEILEKCHQTKNIREQFCAFLKAGKVRGHHPIISYNTLIKH